MKICVVTSTYPRFPEDGAGRFVQSLSEALVEIGHQVHVVAPYHPRVRPANGPVHIHHFRYVWPPSLAIMGYAEAMQSDRQLKPLAFPLAPMFFASALATLFRLVRQVQFDVIHAHWVIPNGPTAALIARMTGRPLVITLHGSDIFVSLNNRILGRLARRLFHQAAGITACSPDLYAGALELGADKQRTHLIPWGANPDVFARPLDTALLRTRWNLGPDQPVVLSLARLVRKKGLEFLIRAAPAVIAQQPDTRFMIVGDGPEKPNLIRLAQELDVADRIVFTGEVAWEEVAQYLQLCDVFAVPSIHDAQGNVDGLPTTILEAMAAGKPVVGSNIAGIPLVVRHGQTGLLVEEQNPEQLATALLDLLHKPELARKYGCTAQERVRQELNWHQIALKFAAIYRQEV